MSPRVIFTAPRRRDDVGALIVLDVLGVDRDLASTRVVAEVGEAGNALARRGRAAPSLATTSSTKRIAQRHARDSASPGETRRRALALGVGGEGRIDDRQQVADEKQRAGDHHDVVRGARGDQLAIGIARDPRTTRTGHGGRHGELRRRRAPRLPRPREHDLARDVPSARSMVCHPLSRITPNSTRTRRRAATRTDLRDQRLDPRRIVGAIQ